MKRGGGKRKGSSFEREISRTLSLWVTNGERDDVLWRSQNSGGRFTVRKKKNLKTANAFGDIAYTHDDGKPYTELFCTECKDYRDLDLWSLVQLNDNGLLKFWKENQKVADSVERSPILIAKQNRKPIVFICTRDVEKCLKTHPRAIFNIKNESLFLFLLKDVMSENFNEVYTKLKEGRN
jgi:hypothetical protein